MARKKTEGEKLMAKHGQITEIREKKQSGNGYRYRVVFQDGHEDWLTTTSIRREFEQGRLVDEYEKQQQQQDSDDDKETEAYSDEEVESTTALTAPGTPTPESPRDTEFKQSMGHLVSSHQQASSSPGVLTRINRKLQNSFAFLSPPPKLRPPVIPSSTRPPPVPFRSVSTPIQRTPTPSVPRTQIDFTHQKGIACARLMYEIPITKGWTESVVVKVKSLFVDNTVDPRKVLFKLFLDFPIYEERWQSYHENIVSTVEFIISGLRTVTDTPHMIRARETIDYLHARLYDIQLVLDGGVAGILYTDSIVIFAKEVITGWETHEQVDKYLQVDELKDERNMNELSRCVHELTVNTDDGSERDLKAVRQMYDECSHYMKLIAFKFYAMGLYMSFIAVGSSICRLSNEWVPANWRELQSMCHGLTIAAGTSLERLNTGPVVFKRQIQQLERDLKQSTTETAMMETAMREECEVLLQEWAEKLESQRKSTIVALRQQKEELERECGAKMKLSHIEAPPTPSTPTAPSQIPSLILWQLIAIL
jgi:hypothetical protein